MKDSKNLERKKVVLGMSGGVDSTTAALLLHEKGFEVYAMHLDVLGKGESRAIAEEAFFCAFPDAGADKFIYIDAASEFKDKIINQFALEYLNGRTPNPCILCNPHIKFRYLAEVADRVGAYYIATGHYAKICKDNMESENFFVQMADSKKDQSYMLYRLPKEIICRLILPLESLTTKEDVREIAREHKMPNSETKDSQEICFLAKDTTYIDFIKNLLQERELDKYLHNIITVNKRSRAITEGDFIDKKGNVLGRHCGLINYTIGQRKGLGITFGKPVFVTAMNKETNEITLGNNEDLFTDTVISVNNFFTETGNEKIPKTLKNTQLYAKIRYAAQSAKVHIKDLGNGKILAKFEEQQRAATPGQSIVFYNENIVVGGGIIE